MTIKGRSLSIWVAAVVFAITVAALTGPRQSVAASVEDIAMMKSADRQKILIEGAKKEGKIMWYTTLIVDQVVRPVKEAFEKEYPFIQIDFYRGNAENLVRRMLAEYQAKRYDVDLIDGTVSPVMVQRAGLLQRFYSPYLAEYPAELKDAQGFWGSTNLYFLTPGYNTRMVKLNELPKTYQDLAESALERSDDVVDQPWLRSADIHRQCADVDGTRSRQGVPAEIKGSEYRQEHRQQPTNSRPDHRRGISHRASYL